LPALPWSFVALSVTMGGARQVMASRHPRLLLRVHRFRDEVFFLLMLLVERQCLHTCQASIAEHLFSLIRAGPGSTDVTRRQLRLSLVLLVLLPYAQRKMERLCESQLRVDDEREQLPLDSAAGGSGFQFPVEARQWARMNSSQPLTARVSNVLSQGIGQLQDLQGWRSAVMLVYPWMHASYESAVLVQQILYLFGQTKFCSPRLLLLGLELRRALGSDSQRLQDLLDKTRAAQLAWSNTYRMPLKHIFRFFFRFWHFVNDNTKVRFFTAFPPAFFCVSFGLALVFGFPPPASGIL
jgi:hypothetical protein